MTRPGRVLVGTSGWTYPYWRGDFYPGDLVQRRELEYLAERTTTVEINASFYSLQRPSSYRRWAEATPDDYVLAVKGSRYVTHMLRLRNARTGLANFYASGVLALGARTGPFLWQLPEHLELDADVLGAFLASLPRTTSEAADLAREHDAKVAEDRVLTSCDVALPLRHALEPRHPSFVGPEGLAVLRAHDVALVVADSGGRFPEVDEVTSDHVYVRLHGPDGRYDGGYDNQSLDAWASRCRDWSGLGLDVEVYFNNDGHSHAPHDARRLLDRL